MGGIRPSHCQQSEEGRICPVFGPLRPSTNSDKLSESRKIRAQELRNQQLEEEFATLRRLKGREQELQFELFVAQLTAEDLARLEHEPQVEIKPHIGLSPAFQMTMHKDSILKQWFAQRTQLHQERRGHR